MHLNLKTATETLYTTFKKYHVAGDLRGRSCDCCVTHEEIRLLLSKPLTDLSEDEISPFFRSAISTFGNVEDFKHFLPRILELMQNSNSDILDDFMCYEKLNYSEWETWEAQEITAIDNYFTALWTKIISSESSSIRDIESALEIICKYTSIDKAFEIWEKHISKNNLIFIIETALNGYQFSNNDISIKFSKWIKTKPVLDKIEALFFKTEDNELASRISITHTLIEYS